MEANNNYPGNPAAPPPAGPTPQVPGAVLNPMQTLNGTTFEYTCISPTGGSRTETVQVYSPRFFPKVSPIPPNTGGSVANDQ